MKSLRTPPSPAPVHTCAPAGEEIEVTGIYTHSYDLGLSQKAGFPVFGTLIEANYIQKRQDQFSVHRLTDDDRREILALARDPQVRVVAQPLRQSLIGWGGRGGSGGRRLHHDPTESYIT